MKLEELEEILNPIKKELPLPEPVVKKETIPAPAKSFEREIVPYTRPNLEPTLEGPSRGVSSCVRIEELSSKEKDLIANDCLDFINRISRGIPLTRRDISGLEHQVYAYLGAYMYRWYPYLYPPDVSCIVRTSSYDSSFSLTITLDDIHICTIGLRGR